MRYVPQKSPVEPSATKVRTEFKRINCTRFSQNAEKK